MQGHNKESQVKLPLLQFHLLLLVYELNTA